MLLGVFRKKQFKLKSERVMFCLPLVCRHKKTGYFCLVLYACVQFCFYGLWSPSGKGLTSWLSFVMSNCEVVTLPNGILGQVWCWIEAIPDLCHLSNFDVIKQKCVRF